jgi:hypothetical protein
VVGDRVRVRAGRGGEGLAHAPVDLSPPGGEHPVVERLADERVGEAHRCPVRQRSEQPGLLRPLHGVEQGLLGGARHRGPERQRHRLADDRAPLEQGAGRLPQPVHARVDDLLQRHGQADRRQIAEHPGLPVVPQHLRILQGAQELGGEEGVALRPRGEPGDEAGGVPGRQRIAALRQRPQRRRVQRAEREARGAGLALEEGQEPGERMAARQLVGAIRGEQQERQGGEVACQGAQQVEGGGIGPVQVVEEDDERPGGGEGGQVGQGAADGGVLAGQHFRGAFGGQHRRRQGVRTRADRRAPERLGPGAIGGRLAQVVAAPDQHQRPLRPGLGQEHLGQRRLADPGLAADEH